jgi:HSP20 family protein
MESGRTRTDSSVDARNRQDERNRDDAEGTRSGRELARRETAMPYLVTRDPWLSPHLEVMRSMIRDFNRMLGDWSPASPIATQTMTSWPRIEMFDRDGSLVVRAEMPGLSKEDVKVRVQEDTLVIEGERRSENEARREGYYETEFSYGRFSRRIPLPAGADPEQIQARFQNGVLEVVVRMSLPATREIPIRTT